MILLREAGGLVEGRAFGLKGVVSALCGADGGDVWRDDGSEADSQKRNSHTEMRGQRSPRKQQKVCA